MREKRIGIGTGKGNTYTLEEILETDIEVSLQKYHECLLLISGFNHLQEPLNASDMTIERYPEIEFLLGGEIVYRAKVAYSRIGNEIDFLEIKERYEKDEKYKQQLSHYISLLKQYQISLEQLPCIV